MPEQFPHAAAGLPVPEGVTLQRIAEALERIAVALELATTQRD